MASPTIPVSNQLPSNNVPTELNADNILQELEKDLVVDEEKPKEEKPKVEVKPDGEEQEEKDEKEETEEIDLELQPDINNDEFVAPVARKDILAKYPTLFKDFPYLERAYYRDQQFTEVASTPEQAKELVEKAQEFDTIREQITSGDITPVLQAIKGTEKYEEFVDNFLGQLAKVDQNAYFHTIGNIYRTAIANLYIEGKESNDSDLMQAAEILNKQLFGNTRIIQPRPLARQSDPKISEAEQRIQAKEQELQKREFNRTYTELSTKTDNALNAAISQHIDPKDVMPPYVKKAAMNEAMETTKRIMNEDKKFIAHMEGLWQDAFKKQFDPVSVSKIRTAYLSRARTVLPNVIKNVRAEALKGLNTKSRTDKEEIIGSRSPSGNKNRSAGSQETGQRNQIPKGMTTLDYLNSD